jgi:competence protein ComEC
MIDTGPKSPSFDAGQKIVLPDLDKIGADTVDLILLSHPDQDHVGGVSALHKAFPKARIAMSDQFKGYPAMEQHLKDWGMADADIIWLGSNAAIRLGEFSMTIHDPVLQSGENDNEGSMFIRLAGPSGSATFSGDADDPTEKAMEREDDWTSQVMKVGHHGSKSSTDPTWLTAVHPQYAVISCGINNMYGHPAQITLDKLHAAGIPTFRTDLQGDIEFDYDSKKGFAPSESPYVASSAERH